MSKKGGEFDEASTTVTSTLQVLREQAEVRLGKKAAFSAENIASLTPDAARQMLHELRVHQIELEMQNEELRESYHALDSLQARYFDLYDMAPLGYLTINEQGLIRQANLTAASLLGMTRGELVNKPLSRIIFKQDQDVFYLKRQRLAETGESQSFELRLKRLNSTQFWALLVITAAYDADGASELRIALSNIDERKQLEADHEHLEQILQAKNTELEYTRIVAENASQAKSDFLSRMSHELRTPLNAILGFAQLIDTGAQQPTPSQKRSLSQILKAGWYLLDLINEVLDLAMIESGKLSLTLESVLLSDVICECQEMIGLQAESREISLHFPSAEKSYFVRADYTRLKQILINLLSNAIKYNKVGGSIIVSYNTSTVGRVRICVEDTGSGLPPEKLAHLYEPFNRLGLEHHTEDGTGIGLVVCKRLVELMGGVIGVESTEGVGSVFWFEMNLETGV